MSVPFRYMLVCACLMLAVSLTACLGGDETAGEAQDVAYEIGASASACPNDWEEFEDCSEVPIHDGQVVISAGGRVVWEGSTDERGEVSVSVPARGDVVITLSSRLFDVDLEHELHVGSPDVDASASASLRAPHPYVLEPHEGPPPG